MAVQVVRPNRQARLSGGERDESAVSNAQQNSLVSLEIRRMAVRTGVAVRAPEQCQPVLEPEPVQSPVQHLIHLVVALTQHNPIQTDFSLLRSNLLSKPILVALANDSLFIYDQVPQSTDEWLQPSATYLLLTTRLVVQTNNLANYYQLASSSTSLALNQQSNGVAVDEFLFLTRHGTPHGIQSHLYRCVNHMDLINWCTIIEKQIYAAVALIKHVDFSKQKVFFWQIKIFFAIFKFFTFGIKYRLRLVESRVQTKHSLRIWLEIVRHQPKQCSIVAAELR